MKIILFFTLSLSPLFCLGQQIMGAGNLAWGTKVIVKNFYRSPPDCGFRRTISIYEAEIIDSLSIVPGKKMLFCVECKAEKYRLVKGDHFTIRVDGECPNDWGYNFTDYTDEELKKMKIFHLIFLAESQQ